MQHSRRSPYHGGGALDCCEQVAAKLAAGGWGQRWAPDETARQQRPRAPATANGSLPSQVVRLEAVLVAWQHGASSLLV